MRFSYGAKSIMLFLFSVGAFLLLTLFESTLSGLPLSLERIISFVSLVLPGLVGVLFGVLGIVYKESRKWIAITGGLLNGLFATFITFVLSFAG
jgi:hypothetical protein